MVSVGTNAVALVLLLENLAIVSSAVWTEACAARGAVIVVQHRDVRPNVTVAPIHNRMPVLFAGETEWNVWLHPDAILDELHKMLAPAEDNLLEAATGTRDLLRVHPAAIGGWTELKYMVLASRPQPIVELSRSVIPV